MSLWQDKKAVILLVLFFIVTVVAVSLIFFRFVYVESCNDEQCFSESLISCDRASFVRSDDNADWYYRIEGRADSDSCAVYVKLSNLRSGDISLENLNGKDMTCLIPYGVVESPQRDIDRCSGSLKEEIQSVLIKKMHSYLLENIGTVNSEFQNIL